MSLDLEERYAQISQDWRHRDNLTWQLPTVLFVITIAILAGVLQIADSDNHTWSFLISVLFLIGFILSLGFAIMLGQNLWYQLGSTFFLAKIESNITPPSPASSERLITPKDSNATYSKICFALRRKLTGSIVLFIFCGLNTVVFAILFVLSFFLIDYDFPWIAFKNCLLII